MPRLFFASFPSFCKSNYAQVSTSYHAWLIELSLFTCIQFNLKTPVNCEIFPSHWLIFRGKWLIKRVTQLFQGWKSKKTLRAVGFILVVVKYVEYYRFSHDVVLTCRQRTSWTAEGTLSETTWVAMYQSQRLKSNRSQWSILLYVGVSTSTPLPDED